MTMKKIIPLIVVLALATAAGTYGYQLWQTSEHEATSGALRLHGNIDLRDAQLAFFGQERIASLLVEEVRDADVLQHVEIAVDRALRHAELLREPRGVPGFAGLHEGDDAQQPMDA